MFLLPHCGVDMALEKPCGHRAPGRISKMGWNTHTEGRVSLAARGLEFPCPRVPEKGLNSSVYFSQLLRVAGLTFFGAGHMLRKHEVTGVIPPNCGADR